MIAHLTEDQLNDYVDGALRGDERERLERHAARCAACAAEVRKLRALLSRAGALPTSVEPPDDLWPRIAATYRAGIAGAATAPDDARGGRVVPITAPPAGRRRAPWGSRAALAAAAVVLVALSSAVTAVLVRRSDWTHVAVRVGAREGVASGPAAVFAFAEADYERATAELQATLRGRRQRLSPETVAAVERSLATIDRAIREAREALAQDPGNPTLVEILSASYEQKVDLLRRATELLPRS